MKNLMKIFLAFVAAMFMGLSVSFGQSATSPASAVILDDLTIVREADTEIDFGTLSATTPGIVRLDPKVFANSVSVNPNTANAAQFNVVGSVGALITVLYDETVTLQGTGEIPAESMIMTPIVVGASALGGRTLAADIINNGTVTLAAGIINYFIWVGGTLPKLDGQATGKYEGTFNISVAYH